MTKLSARFDALVRHSTNGGFAATQIGRCSPCKDERWPAIADALDQLHATRRHSVRIVDADCGAGSLLLHAVRYARALGFTSIEARGIDGAPSLIERARTAAAVIADPAIGVTFEVADVATALAGEEEFPADILIWHGREACNDQAVVGHAAAAAARLISDPDRTRRAAA